MAEDDAGAARARSNVVEVVADAGEAVADAGEREAVRRSHGSGDDDHLVLLGSGTHTPYLVRHC